MAKKPKKPGPPPDQLTIRGDWRDAMRKALKKERPKDGWPSESAAKEDDERKGEDSKT